MSDQKERKVLERKFEDIKPSFINYDRLVGRGMTTSNILSESELYSLQAAQEQYDSKLNWMSYVNSQMTFVGAMECYGSNKVNHPPYWVG